VNLSRPQTIGISLVSGLVILAGLVAIIVMATNSTDTPSAYPAVADTIGTRSGPTPGELAEMAFISTLQTEGIIYPSEAAILAIGQQICDDLARGRTLLQATLIPLRAGYSSYESGYITGAAKGSICEHRS
jgi:hypothetical protein